MRIYLDNAATSWPKPESVYQAVDHYQRQVGAAAGRGVYRSAQEAEAIVARCRRAAGELLGTSAERIIFAANGTAALNLVLHGLLKPGDHVLTTVVEHNSVLRPLDWLARNRGIEVTHLDCDDQGVVDPVAFEAAIRDKTRLIAIVHASNVTGVVQPVREIARIAREHQVLSLVDAAQSLGHLPIDVTQLGCDFLAAPGHKGLLGPLGTGLLYFRRGTEELVESVMQGGTGTQSEDLAQPPQLPAKFEAGNVNVAALAGLAAGIEHVVRELPLLHRREQELGAWLRAGLATVRGATLHGPTAADDAVGVVSLTLAGYDPQELAALLDSHFGICVRAGLHCAPLLHRRLGTARGGGTVRFSVGAFTTEDEIERTSQAVAEVAGGV